MVSIKSVTSDSLRMYFYFYSSAKIFFKAAILNLFKLESPQILFISTISFQILKHST